MVAATRNLYQVLQIDPAAEQDVIEVVYRRLARKYHLDVSTVPDAAERMKEINSAYEVLHDPSRRASYDRELAVREVPMDDYFSAGEVDLADESERWAQGEVTRCSRHPGFGSVASCTDCGGGLCAYCARLFQPPTCASCLIRWAGRKRFTLALPVVALPGLFGAGYLAWAWLLQAVGLAPSVWLVLALAYWTGSILFGVRGAREVAPTSDTIVLGFIACLVGPVVAPVLVGRSLWEYRQMRRLEAIARTN